MKVNGYQPVSSVSQSDSSRTQGTQKTTRTSSELQQQADVVTHLSQLPQDSSQDIDHVRVAELRDAIRDGKLVMNTEKIAEALLQDLTEG